MPCWAQGARLSTAVVLKSVAGTEAAAVAGGGAVRRAPACGLATAAAAAAAAGTEWLGCG